MSDFEMGAKPENLYRTPEIEELNLDVNNAFLDSTGSNWKDGGED